MTKYLSGIVLVATIVVAACSGGSSPASNPGNTQVSSWAITSFTSDETTPFVGSPVQISATVTKDGSAPPDGTVVTIEIVSGVDCTAADGDSVFPCGLGSLGSNQVNLATVSGHVTTAFVSLVESSYRFRARANTATKTLDITYVERAESTTLQITPPLLPNQGSYDGGEQVVIRGKGIAAPVEVDFIVGATTYSVVIENVQESIPLPEDGSITIRTPFITDVDRTQSSAATVVVRGGVNTGGDQAASLPGGFTYLAEAPFQIYQPLIPNRGLYDGGLDVTMNGVGIREDVEVSFVLGSNEFPAIVTSVQPSVPTTATGHITVSTPFIPDALRSDLEGSDVVDVVVTTYEPQGDSFSVTLPSAFTYFADVDPDIVWSPLQIFQPLVPNEGYFRGGEMVTITGQAIREPVGVEFTVGGFTFPGIVTSVAASTPPNGTGQIVVETPYISGVPWDEALAADVKIRVAGYLSDPAPDPLDPPTIAELPGAFTFIPDPIAPEPYWVLSMPAFYLVVPDYGSAAGGQSVTIMGRNFRAQLLNVDGVTVLDTAPAVESVSFGGIDGIVQAVSPDGTQIQVLTPRYSTTPLDADTPVDVDVVTSYVEVTDTYTVTKASAFVFTADEPTPEITALAPSGGPIDGGTQVTLFGHGFQSPAQVFFGNLECIGVQVNDDRTLADQDTIVCVTPDYSQQGEEPPVSVDVRVRNVLSGKETTSPEPFTYGSNLYISGNTPVEGTRGTNVIIYGSGFEAPLTVDMTCADQCGAEFRLDVLSVSGTEILVRIPIDAPIVCEAVEASFFITLLESNLETDGGDFRYLGSTPQIYGITPTFVDEDGGGEMTITGDFFADQVVISVRDYRLQSNVVTVVDENQIIVDPLPSAELIGLVWDTSPCVDNNGLPGFRVIPTPVDVTVTNMPGDCSETVLGGLVYEPESTICFTGLLITPTSRDFGLVDVPPVDVNPPTERTFTVTNPGSINVNMTAATSSPHFFVDTTFAILSPGDSIVVTVTFAPQVGAVNPPNTTAFIQATLNIGANFSGISAIVTQATLTGTAIAIPEIVTNPFGQGDLWTFPTTAAGACSTIDATSELTISNTGNAVLSLVSFVTTGPYTIAAAPLTTINPGESTVAILQFCPVVDDNTLQSGALTITSNDTSEPVITIDLEGQELP